MIHSHRLIVQALTLVGAFFVACHLRAADPPSGIAISMSLVVTDHSGIGSDEPLYMASSLNNWNPADPKFQLKKSRTEPPTWQLELTPQQLSGHQVEFKITRGSWDSVEVDADGKDIGNRSIGESSWAMGETGLVMKVDVQGYADQRGTRWAIPTDRETQRREPSVTGTLDIFDVESKTLGNTRKVRVWLPRGYNNEANKDHRYPVLYMHDGQNVFDRSTSFAGVEWGADETAQNLIDTGKIEPLIIVGIDNTGATRSREYNPSYTTFDGQQNYAEKYVDWLTSDLMPMINQRYRTATGPANTSLGGSSFGGNVTIFAAMHAPGTFGRLLVESPAVMISDKAIVARAREFSGEWPSRIFVGVGTKETSRAGEAESYLTSVKELASVLESKGLSAERLKLEVENGGIHNESTWARRLPGAMMYLFGK